MAETIAIAVGANEAYAMPMTVALHSALRHMDRACSTDVFIIDGGISENSKRRVERILTRAHPDTRLHWVTPDPEAFAGLHVGRYTAAALFRLLLPEVIPERHDRVLYLDCDTVTTDDISKLWHIDLGTDVFGAVEAASNADFDRRIRSKFPAITDVGNGKYFNSGVMLIQMPQWRRKGISALTLDFLALHNGQLSFPDQDALNAVAVGQWSPLEPRWNAQIHNLGPARGTRGITHYTTFKPWNQDFTGDRKWTFFEAYMRSGWDSPTRALGWTVTCMGEQVIRHNFKRISRRLGRN